MLMGPAGPSSRPKAINETRGNDQTTNSPPGQPLSQQLIQIIPSRPTTNYN